jgi:hypothetical protein
MASPRCAVRPRRDTSMRRSNKTYARSTASSAKSDADPEAPDPSPRRNRSPVVSPNSASRESTPRANWILRSVSSRTSSLPASIRLQLVRSRPARRAASACGIFAARRSCRIRAARRSRASWNVPLSGGSRGIRPRIFLRLGSDAQHKISGRHAARSDEGASRGRGLAPLGIAISGNVVRRRRNFGAI